ncbi:UNKNOWN [Stylonychia lemnae]|uniref:Protein kinase domain-containing protein n=1 Tax=Stylonychia lemnae TaxID=5949 RepID=A0A078AGI4_STYLE|nr:UNKNOWN [Stylonychia lemnae]|eukprot:CDW79963.1 UNKNOWN [Stylonychia lemnae]
MQQNYKFQQPQQLLLNSSLCDSEPKVINLKSPHINHLTRNYHLKVMLIFIEQDIQIQPKNNQIGLNKLSELIFQVDDAMYNSAPKSPILQQIQNSTQNRKSKFAKNKSNTKYFDKENGPNKFQLDIKVNTNTTSTISNELSTDSQQFLNFYDLFKLKRLLGFGAFGVVLMVKNIKHNEVSALKIINKTNLSKSNLNQFRNEFKVLQKLDHCGVIKSKRTYETQNYLLIELEYFEGITLKKFQDQIQSEDNSRAILKCILEGLNHIHDKDFIHRDLKTDNILISVNNALSVDSYTNLDSIGYEVKIIDFGLSTSHKVLSFEQIDDNIGTLVYMAPEQAKSKSYGKRIDVWACGIIMYQLLTRGKHPIYYDGQNRDEYNEALDKIMSGQSKWEFPQGFSDYVAFVPLRDMTVKRLYSIHGQRNLGKREQVLIKKKKTQVLRQSVKKPMIDSSIMSPKQTQSNIDISPMKMLSKNIALGRNTPVLRKDSIKFNSNSKAFNSRTNQKEQDKSLLAIQQQTNLGNFLKTPIMKKNSHKLRRFHEFVDDEQQKKLQLELPNKSQMRSSIKRKLDYLESNTPTDYQLKLNSQAHQSSIQQEQIENYNAQKLDFTLRKLRTRKITQDIENDLSDLLNETQNSFQPKLHQRKSSLSQNKNYMRRSSMRKTEHPQIIGSEVHSEYYWNDNLSNNNNYKENSNNDIQNLMQARVQSQKRNIKNHETRVFFNGQLPTNNNYQENTRLPFALSSHSSIRHPFQQQQQQNHALMSPIVIHRNNRPLINEYTQGLASMDSKHKLEKIYRMQEIVKGFQMTSSPYQHLQGALNIQPLAGRKDHRYYQQSFQSKSQQNSQHNKY